MTYARSMKRRTAILGLSGALLLPSLISRAFAQSVEGARREFAETLGRARAAQRPVLVMVIPTAADAASLRGRAFGTFLNHGPEDAIAALDTVELVCMRVAELRAVIPNVGDAEPLLLLIDPAATPAHVTRFDGVVPPPPMPWGGDLEDGPEGARAEQARRAAEEQAIDRQIAAVAEQVLRALHGRLQALSAPQRAQALQQARSRYVEHRVPGSYWMRAGRCGVEIEEPPPGHVVVSMDCGMGHAPARAQRFLNFFVQRGERE